LVTRWAHNPKVATVRVGSLLLREKSCYASDGAFSFYLLLGLFLALVFALFFQIKKKDNESDDLIFLSHSLACTDRFSRASAASLDVNLKCNRSVFLF